MQNQTKTGEAPWTILKLLRWTTSYFKSHNVENPRASAEILLAHTLGLRRIDLYVRYDQPLFGEELARFKSLIRRRVKREPVAYIVGEKEFWSLTLRVTPDVLIPRPETECLVEAALAILPDDLAGGRVLELGTGSGAISLALASERPGYDFFASDRSPRAVCLARENARHNGLAESVRFFCADWFKALGINGPVFDLILSNPPYIETAAIPQLQPEIRLYEPAMALDGGGEGLDALDHIVAHAHVYLKTGGVLLTEIGYDQGERIRDLALAEGYEAADVIRDYAGHDRVVRMRKGAGK